MANRLYGLAREAFLNGDISWGGDNIKAYLINTTLYDAFTGGTLDTDQFIPTITGIGGAVIATTANLAGKSVTLGVARSDPFVFSVVAGAAGNAVVLWQDTGVAATSRLIAWIDTVASGLPTPAGTVTVTVTPDAGANGLFKL